MDRLQKILSISGLCLTLLLSACTEDMLLFPDGTTDDTQNGSFSNREAAIQKALSLFPGTVREVERELEEGVSTWKVDIIDTNGAEVEIYIRESDGSLFRIDGESGPFTYNLMPGNALLAFADVLALATEQGLQGLAKWRLRKDDSYGNAWVYTLRFENQEIVFRADDGVVLIQSDDSSDDSWEDDSPDDNSSDDDSSDDDSPNDNSSDDNSSSASPTSEAARQRALELFPGTVREVERQVEEGVSTWKVDMVGAGGAAVEIYLRESDGSLFRIDGESGPFTYDITPGNGLQGFTETRAKADAASSGDLEEWRLRKDDSYGNAWVYEFKYDDLEVIIRATDGNVLEVKD